MAFTFLPSLTCPFTSSEAWPCSVPPAPISGDHNSRGKQALGARSSNGTFVVVIWARDVHEVGGGVCFPWFWNCCTWGQWRYLSWLPLRISRSPSLRLAPFLPDGREPALMGTGLTFLLQPRRCPRAPSSPEPLSTRGASTSSLLPSHHLDLLDSVGLLFAVLGIIFFFKLLWF